MLLTYSMSSYESSSSSLAFAFRMDIEVSLILPIKNRAVKRRTKTDKIMNADISFFSDFKYGDVYFLLKMGPRRFPNLDGLKP